MAGVVTTLFAIVVVVGILIPPLLPEWRSDVRTLTSSQGGGVVATTREARERVAARRRLFLALGRRREALGLHPAQLPVSSARTKGRLKSQLATGSPITAGFYVNWDDNSFSSFNSHVQDLDWIVCEWAFVAAGGDSLRFMVDRRVLYTAQQQPEGKRPLVFAMVSNYDSARATFDPKPLRRLLATRATRDHAVQQLTAFVARYGLAGVNVDFEDVPARLHPQLLEFVRALDISLDGIGRLTTQSLPAELDPTWLARYAKVNDRIFLMVYDEHYGKGDPGPVASQAWYEETVRRALRYVSPDRVILAVGAYGYDWNDAGAEASGSEMTFQDVMTAARDHGATVRFDSVSLNPYLEWTDPDSTDHVVWYLDAVTAYNQARAGRALGVAGQAVWRLGSEDPALWHVLGRRAGTANPTTALKAIPPGYDVEFQRTGELLQLTARPTEGERQVQVDARTGLVTGQRLVTLPSPYVVRRYGAQRHQVALTFDDGPDGTWTPMILDTLMSRGAPATFFVIGANVERHIPLMRRIVREGHEFGNHTFTHPNLALTPTFVTRLELDATERLLEAVVNRRSVFFRPPYFGDAEPTTADELVPVGIATDLGYVTAGLHVDSQDWVQPGVQTIIDTVLAQRSRGNVVLLHDGGGNRSQTVAAIGPLIDSLRARGDTLVPLSELAGITPQAAMPGLPATGAATRVAELALFGLFGGTEWALYWIFLFAVVLGVFRLVWILALAMVQRFRRRPVAESFTPPVSVVVPAYNEERVIAATIRSLLGQEYGGKFEIIVVDDGSPDATFEVARTQFGTEPRVRIYRKPNGGKASALNYGIAQARGEIVVCLDADTLFAPNTLRELVQPLKDPKIGAVAGNAKVGNRINLVTRWQAVEYVTSQNLDRRAFSLLNCITVVPGAVGAWRRALVQASGGFKDDTLAEDQDLTLMIRRAGHAIAYADHAIGYTEAPDTLRSLARQRFRWSFGTLQCAWKHRDVLFRPRYGSLGFIAMPSVWLFQLVLTAISPIADLMFLWSLISVWLVKAEHGATYALTNLEHVLTYYAVFLLVDWLAAMAAFLLEPGEDRSLTWLIVLQRFAYRQVMYWVVVRAFLVAVRGHLVGWGKLERKATVQVPA